MSKLFRFGGRVGGPGFRAVFARRSDDRVGLSVVVSKKISKKAVDRNYMKRIFKEAVKKRDLKALDLVLILRQKYRNLVEAEAAVARLNFPVKESEIKG